MAITLGVCLGAMCWRGTPSMAAALFLLGAGVFALVAHRVAQPVRSVEEAMDRMRNGDTSARAETALGGDVDRVASTFNLMLDGLAQAERVMHENEERFELVLEGARLGLWDWNISTGQVFFNERWTSMLGFGFHEIEPHWRSWEKLVHPADLPIAYKAIHAHMSGQTAHYECEYRMRTKSGQWKWILDQGKVVLRDDHGRALRFTGTHADVTERHEMQDKLRENQARLTEAQRVAHLGSWDWDLKSGAMNWSDECYRILAVDPSRTINTFQSFLPFVHPADRDRILEAGATFSQGAAGNINEFRLVRPDGQVRFVLSKSRVYCNAIGQPTRKLGTIQDITERKAVEERLRESNAMMLEALERERSTAMELEAAMEQLAAATQEAQAAVRSKTEFLANMSHEIRTPMTAILGYAEVIAGAYEEAQTMEPKQVLEHLRTIQRNGNYLLEIINGILDISKIEAGKIEVECIRCSPVAILTEVRELMRVRADERGLPIHVETVGAFPEIIETDPARVKQILINIVGNAIKFTESGSVTIQARFIESVPRGRTSRGASMMQFDVIDTGIGMSPEQVARLFKPFAQADSSMSRRFGGTGLGLLISKRFAHILGGDISAESEPGVGSTFRITVATGSCVGVRMIDPLAAPKADSCPGDDSGQGDAPAAAPQPVRIRVPGCRILLVEDGADNQRLISFVLKKAGADVTIAENGQVAVDTVRAAMVERSPENVSPFDIILMDMQMPVMDGYEATGRLRQMGFTGPIIAVTAHAMAHEREKCMGAGCDDFTPKPIDRHRLLATIRKHVQSSVPETRA
jgi:PAS domain S-box-containing protein